MAEQIKLSKRFKFAGDIFKELLKAGWDIETATQFLDNIPDADVDKVVRCKDCDRGHLKHKKMEPVIECQFYHHDDPRQYKGLMDYCSHGVRKEENPCDHCPTIAAAPVVNGYHIGDVCIYGFGHENKSRAVVEIVKILNDERGVAEVKFLKVFVDDTGNGFFNYLLKSGKTMNASFQYLKNITPRKEE